MKKLSALLLAILLIISNTTQIIHANQPVLYSAAGMVLEVESGRLLFSKDADKKMYPASTTKIMTCILAIENSKPDDIVTIDEDAPRLGTGSHIALDVGEQLKMEQLLYALMVASANDAAIAIAKHISGSVEDFAKLMNEKSTALGCTGTHFVNPNGLHDDNHYTTAHDLAKIMSYCIKNPEFIKYASTSYYQIPPTNKQAQERYLNTSNKMLYSQQQIEVNNTNTAIKYDGYTAGKTGYTTVANNCLVSYAQRSGLKLISVVLGANGRDVYIDTHHLLNYGFDNFRAEYTVYPNEYIDNFEIEGGVETSVPAVAQQGFTYPLQKDSSTTIDRKLVKKALKAPIKSGDVVGSIVLNINGEIIGEVPLLSAQTIALADSSNSSTTLSIFLKFLPWAIIVLMIALRAWSIHKRNVRRRKRRLQSRQ